jgi:hypothetical protein
MSEGPANNGGKSLGLNATRVRGSISVQRRALPRVTKGLRVIPSVGIAFARSADALVIATSIALNIRPHAIPI